jgi:homoserine dehydrogenase
VEILSSFHSTPNQKEEMSTSRINVAIIGVGLVGSEVISQLTTVANLKKTFAIVALQNSKKTLLIDPKTADSNALSDWKTKLTNCSQSALPLPELTSHLSKLENHTVVVDNTSNDDVASFYPNFLKAGLSVVTPNKKAFSSSLELYKQILEAAATPSTSTGRTPLLYGESTVGAGLPVLSTLKDIIETGDEVVKIEGILSGTLSYIFNEWSTPKGSTKKFSEIVKIAKEQGYTEPHPGDDLSGSDVARKLAILSRLIPSLRDALPQGYQSVATRSLTPAPLADVKDGQEYVDKLPQFDAEFDALNSEAQKNGNVLRYVGVIDVEKKEIKASLEQYPATHPFATGLQDSVSTIAFTTKRFNKFPMSVTGAGAGAAVTAHGVISDLIKVAERRI